MNVEPLFGWIPQLLSFLLSLVPHCARLPAHECGIKVSGEKVSVIDRRWWSWYCWLPRFTEVFTDNKKRKVRELSDQLLTTKDGVRVRVGGLVKYSVYDPVKWMLENEDPDSGIIVDAKRLLRVWIKSNDFAAIQEYDPYVNDDDLTDLAVDNLDFDFGVAVEELGISSFAKTDSRDIHHSGSIAGVAQMVEE